MPYVGADYPAAVAELVRRVAALGHRRLAYLGEGAGPESFADRLRGFTAAVTERGARGHHWPVPAAGPAALLDRLLPEGVTAAFMEEYAERGGARGGRAGPGRGSAGGAVDRRAWTPDPAGGHQPGPDRVPDPAAGTGLAGSGAAHRADRGHRSPAAVRQQLLACELVDGATLVPPSRSARRHGRED